MPESPKLSDKEQFFCIGAHINNPHQEISQLKKTEAQLAKTLSLVRGTLESAAYGIVAVSYEGEILNRNQKFLEMWRIPDSLTLSKDSEECQNFFARQLKNPEVFSRSVWEISRESEAEAYDILELKDGRVFVQYSKPQRLDDKIIGRVWSIWDITELKQQTELELENTQGKIEAVQTTEEAQQLSQLRSRFVSMLCHQFRSLLNIISFSNSLLKRSKNKWADNIKLPSYFDNIQTAVEQINVLLDELTFFGKSEVGQIDFNPKHIDLNEFCCTLIAQMKSLSDYKQQTIEFFSRRNCTTTCIDKNILHHVLTNLLSNAINYSPNGSKIEFKILGEKEQVIIEIKDKGIGISEIDQPQIFEPFFRGSNVGSSPGNGLGLSIVKNLVEIHGGEIEVESKVGMGSKFSLTLTVLPIQLMDLT
ncbi:MAG: ATP-binding protein [Waterburya sp.]